MIEFSNIKKDDIKCFKLNEKIFSYTNSKKDLNASQKECIILHDKLYIKKMLLYYGKLLLAKSVDNHLFLLKQYLV